MQKKPYFIALFLLMFIAGLSAPSKTLAQTAIKIGFYQIRPHIFLNKDKKVTGAAPLFWKKYLEQEMKVSVGWYGPLTLKRLMVYLRVGVVHAAIILPGQETDKNFLIRPQMPFYTSRSTLLVVADNQLKSVTSAQALKGMQIAFSQELPPSPFITDNRIPLKRMAGGDWIQQSLTAMMEKKIDAIYFPDEYMAKYYQQGLKLSDQVREVPLPEKEIPYYTVFSKAKGQALCKLYEEAQNKLQRNDINYTDILNAFLK